MKKFTLIVCALALSVATFAVPARTAKITSEQNKMKVVKVQADQLPVKKQVAEKKDTTSLYLTYPQSYKVGTPDGGIYYGYYGLGLIAPYAENIVFYNDSQLSATWLVGDEEVAKDAWFYKMPVEFGENELPVMRVNEDDTYHFLDYQTAGTRVAYLKGKGYASYYNSLNVAPAEFMPLTLCSMYTETTADGQDCLYQVSVGAYGTYMFGTNTKNPWQNTTLDSIAVFFDNEGLMVVDHISLGVYTAASSGDAMFPGENDHIRLTIYPQTAQGGIDWSNPIATATANSDNYLPDDEDNTIGLLFFEFLQEDPGTHAMTPGEIELEGAFVVVLDDYNGGTANFGILSDYYAAEHHTFYPWTSLEEQKMYISRVWGCNIMLNVMAFMPAFVAPEKVAFAEGETEKVLDIPSNVWDEDIELDEDETSEWITVEIATDYETEEYEGEEYYIHNFVNKLTITLEESEEVREGKIVLSAYGLPVTIKVSQNDAATAVENITFKNDGKLYNVLGIEVGEDYKGVVIRNGEKFVK